MYETSLLSLPGKFEPILLSSVSKNEVKELIKKNLASLKTYLVQRSEDLSFYVEANGSCGPR